MSTGRCPMFFDPAQATLGLCFRVNYQKRWGLLELRHRPQPVP